MMKIFELVLGFILAGVFVFISIASLIMFYNDWKNEWRK